MDDDLLADDGQFKDEGLDDLDLDEEAALLGLSDEEIEDKRNVDDEQELEYVDEDGNPVEIGENNAGLYEIANVTDSRDSPEDDILDLDLDSELDSFVQEGPEISTRKSPVKSYEKQNKRNLISLTSQKDQEKPLPLKKRESFPKPSSEIDSKNSTIAYVSKSLTSSSHPASQKFDDELEFDEESEDEGMEDDHRERFKSERSNIITLTPAKKRADIPDTLDSVISVEETAKVQAFLENEQKRKMRFKGRPLPRMKSATYSRQPFMNKQPSPQQHQQSSEYSNTVIPESSQSTSSTQSRKILINPHFRGVRVPPPSDSGQAPLSNENPPAAMPLSTYEQPAQNVIPPVYSHQDTTPQINVPPPNYNVQSTIQYTPDYPPQLNMQQAPVPIWQTPPPELPPPVSFPNPLPPVMNYSSQPSYHNSYNTNTFQGPNYSTPPPPIQMSQPVSYNQPPPPLHLPPPVYTSPPISSTQTNMSHLIHSTNQTSIQQNNLMDPFSQQPNIPQSSPPILQQNTYSQNHPNRQQNKVLRHQNRPSQQNLRPLQQNLRPLQQNNSNQQNRLQNQQQNRLQNQQQNRLQNQQQNRIPNQQQNRFLRQAEKRPLNTNFREVPFKQARVNASNVKKNARNSNIKEIPLVDTVSTAQTPVSKVAVQITEEEDEETKELRKKIEEQKQLREQILKQKEMRRRQMAAQRLNELKKRQTEQNKNVIPLTESSKPPVSAKQPIPQQKPAPVKLSVKERIGLPVATGGSTPVGKKKIVVLKKKPVPTANDHANAEPKKVVPLGQRIGTQSTNQIQQKPIIRKLTAVSSEKSTAMTAKATPIVKKKIISLKKSSQINTSPTTVPKTELDKTNIVKTNLKQNQKGPVQSRLGNRPNFCQKNDFKSSPRSSFQQRPRVQSPRFQGTRGPQFPSPQPFMDHGMRNPVPHSPINNICLPMSSPPPFLEPRPPLLPFGPPGERMPFNEFMFEHNHPQFHPQGPGDPNHHQFHPPSPGDRNLPQFHSQHPGDPNQFHGPGRLKPRNRQFHQQGPGFQNFRPRGMDMFPPDRFLSPIFQDRSPPRKMFEPNNHMHQRPRFHQGSNRTQRFSRSNFKQQKSVQGKNFGTASSTSAQKDVKSDAGSIVTQNSMQTSTIKREEDMSSSNTTQRESDSPSTQTVEVENLSSSTNEPQLRKLCTTVGVVENIQLMKNERKAVIKFKEAQQALNFHKKYQRFMLDLSMIQVSLVPI